MLGENMKQEIMEKYAQLAVVQGVNIQKGQLLVINAEVKDYEFVRLCVQKAYEVGAGKVMVNFSDEVISKMTYQSCSLETLKEVPEWQYDKKKWCQDKGCAYLHVISDTPGYFDDVDQDKIRESQLASMKKMADLRSYTMNNIGQWCIVALPNEGWAKKVFPNEKNEDAFVMLNDAILKTVRIDENNDPVEQWKLHGEKLHQRCDKMNAYQFDKLHFTSELGTDLEVGLVKNHIWAGGSCFTLEKKVEFNPNMPTEEIFCMPDRNNVNGIVYASKPLSYCGKVIEDFWFKFKDGVVVDYGAKKNKDALDTLLSTDEGSKHLGEVALIPYHSPISLMNILFYDTLFDENASCHLALGACYPENIVGGPDMSVEQLVAAGGNDSMSHCDFMFGTEKMSVIGIKNNQETVIFDNGDFVF